MHCASSPVVAGEVFGKIVSSTPAMPLTSTAVYDHESPGPRKIYAAPLPGGS